MIGSNEMQIRITAERLVTGRGTVHSDVGVIVENGQIKRVGDRDNVMHADVDQTYDLPDHTLLPGLIDAHTHITSNDLTVTDVTMRSSAEQTVDTIENLRTTVESGITTIRDVGSHADIPMVLRDAVEAGMFQGPRIVACGQGLTATGGQGVTTPWHISDSVEGIAAIVDGVPAIRKGVREQIQRGADAIKAWVTGGAINQDGGRGMQFSPTEVETIAAEAERQGVDAIAHAHFPRAIECCARAGFRSIEHGMYLDDESMATMIENDAYLCLTTAVMQEAATASDIPVDHQSNAQDALDNIASMLPKARERGLNLAVGSEAGAPLVPHGDNLRELEVLADLGLDEQTIIELMTRHNAELLGCTDQIGTIEAETRADLIAVDGNPLSDISTFRDEQNPSLVLVDGKPVVEPAF